MGVNGHYDLFSAFGALVAPGVELGYIGVEHHDASIKFALVETLEDELHSGVLLSDVFTEIQLNAM